MFFQGKLKGLEEKELTYRVVSWKVQDMNQGDPPVKVYL